MEKRTGFLYVAIFVLAVIIGGALLLGRHRSEAGREQMGTPTIYTALPSQTNGYYRPFAGALKSFSAQLNASAAPVVTITKQHLDQPTSRFTYDDIWLRDVAPVITTRMVKFRYAPSYLPKADRTYLDTRFRAWLKQMHFQYRTSDLVLDGGNLVWNGHATVILTEHVFKDNPEWSRQEIVSELKYQLNVSHVIIIPAEPGDVLGHADGMVKFINARTLYVSDFSGDDVLVTPLNAASRPSCPPPNSSSCLRLTPPRVNMIVKLPPLRGCISICWKHRTRFTYRITICRLISRYSKLYAPIQRRRSCPLTWPKFPPPAVQCTA